MITHDFEWKHLFKQHFINSMLMAATRILTNCWLHLTTMTFGMSQPDYFVYGAVLRGLVQFRWCVLGNSNSRRLSLHLSWPRVYGKDVWPRHTLQKCTALIYQICHEAIFMTRIFILTSTVRFYTRWNLDCLGAVLPCLLKSLLFPFLSTHRW